MFWILFQNSGNPNEAEQTAENLPDTFTIQEESSILTVPDSRILDSPILDPPTLDPPILDTPISDIPILDTPILDTPITDIPINDIPINDIPITDIPINDIRITDIPINDIRINEPQFNEPQAEEEKSEELSIVGISETSHSEFEQTVPITEVEESIDSNPLMIGSAEVGETQTNQNIPANPLPGNWLIEQLSFWSQEFSILTRKASWL